MKLYKYLPPDPDIVIGNKKLRFTRPSGLNDPFELKPYFESLLDMDQLDPLVRKQALMDSTLEGAFDDLDISERRGFSKEQFKTLLKHAMAQNPAQLNDILTSLLDKFGQELPSLTRSMRAMLDEKMNQIGILSLCENISSNVMWGLYAKSHEGFAVEFDSDHPYFDRRRSQKDEFFHLRKVEYFAERPSYRTMMELDGVKMFCIKDAEFSFEKEWRMLVPLPDAESDASIAAELFDFPESLVSSIIFGMRSEEYFQQAVRKHVEGIEGYAHIRLQIASPDIRTGKMSLSDL